ncbi:unnamed protein product [Protopolystoma xenopodis]|uniref:WW domain-containing protein n=1 Tax=Protopolystoma xenopodis TaxID=117903 RepID=A0A3S5FCG7_9PLAT|nr:unnamed protein product [Protopolystoma xenopodis]
MMSFPMAGYPPFYPVHAYMPPSYIAAPIPPSTPISTLALDNHWVEHTAQDGRKYYYNNSTKQTSWEKPEELKTASEKILDACPWKEFKSENGRTYFYNTITKQSIWVKPHELADAENKAAELNNTLTVVSAPAKYNITAPITPLTPKDTSARPSEPSEIELAMKATLASIEAESQSQDSTQIPLPLNEPVASSKEDEDEEEEEEGQVLEENKVPEYKTRGEMAEGLRTLFRDKNIPGNSTWEQALRLISDDPRYAVLRTFSEKKQIFNVYKTQKQKEEREEQRLKAKKAKEDLEKFLLQCPKIHSTLSYMKINNLLSDASEWAAVPERDKREIYEDVVQEVAKREKEEAKSLRKRNIVVFKEILETMPDLTYQTTWSEAQQLLLENTKFTSDAELQSLDKEDALICFEEHIRLLEQEHDEEKERERRRQKRLQRKHREAFLVLLNELHKHQKLTSISLWKDLFYVINRDERFDKMLAQRGSTPLDLFKFYVESLKARLPAEKKIIKEILKDRGITVELSTSFDNFMEIIQSDLRSEGIDFGNARLTYESLIEKARGRERERQREDARRLKRLEQAFCDMLRAASDPPVRVNSPWEEIRDRFQAHPSYQVCIPLVFIDTLNSFLS